MIKINWGVKIAILYCGFVGLILVMVIMSVNQKIDLVSEDYYNKELMYQDKIEAMKNSTTLSKIISHFITASEIQLQFPDEFKIKKVTGEILFFCPASASRDFKVPVSLDVNARQTISLAMFSKGMYKMQISWKDETKPYFSEETLVIP